MVTRLPLHEIGKVQGDSTNRNHLAKKSKFISPIRPEAREASLSVMAPRADVIIIDHHNYRGIDILKFEKKSTEL